MTSILALGLVVVEGEYAAVCEDAQEHEVFKVSSHMMCSGISLVKGVIYWPDGICEIILKLTLSE